MRGLALIYALSVGQASEGASLVPPVEASTAYQVASLRALGQEAYSEDRYLDALAYLLEVDALVPSASTAFNVAVAALQAGRDALAYTYLARSLGRPDVDERERKTALSRMRLLAPRLALVEVESEPPGAQVAVQGWHLGTYGTTPLILALDPGERQWILLRKRGFEDAVLKVEPKRGARPRLEATLVRERGELTIITTPSSARVLVAGTITATLTSGVASTLPTGSFRVRVEREGFEAAELAVQVRAGVEERRQVVLFKEPPARGRVIVVSGPEALDVFLANRRVATTPTILNLDVGSHALRLERDGLVILERTVDIRPSRAVVVDAGGR